MVSKQGNVYLQKAISLVEEIRRRESENIAAAARIIAESVASGRMCYHCDIGHMLPAETAPGRRGRPKFVVPVAYRLDEMERLSAGDVLVFGSVLGVFALSVDMADCARARGAKVIYIGSPQPKEQDALTNQQQMTKRQSVVLVPPQHPSGRRMSDAADVVINTHVPYTDGCVEIPGRNTPACPLSGVANAVVFWSLMSETVELLVKRGYRVDVD
ncbi:MAG: hypothetical protein ACP5R4_03325 [Armatimonadota bacterium]